MKERLPSSSSIHFDPDYDQVERVVYMCACVRVFVFVCMYVCMYVCI
jgi:hypothetical protein